MLSRFVCKQMEVAIFSIIPERIARELGKWSSHIQEIKKPHVS